MKGNENYDKFDTHGQIITKNNKLCFKNIEDNNKNAAKLQKTKPRNKCIKHP